MSPDLSSMSFFGKPVPIPDHVRDKLFRDMLKRKHG